MRLTLVAFFLCGFLCTGCESLNKTVRWPHKDPAITEQLVNDQKRREAAEQELAQASDLEKNAKAIQQTNFAPTIATGDVPEANLLKAKQAEQARQNQVAKSLYEQVLLQQPLNAEAHHRLGVLADQDGRYPEAQQHYQAALQQQPQNASLLSDIGYSFYSQDRLDEAEQYLRSALQLQPDNQYARNNLAQVYGRRAQQTGSPADYKLAQEQFQLALGPQGAEQQMQQIMPPAGTATDERRSLLNPFKKRGGTEKAPGRMASNLQAPDPKDDGNAALVRQMEQIRAEMEARGEIVPKRPSDGIAQRPAGTSSPPAAIPFNQVNSELSRIDQEASRQQAMALRRGYPTQPRGASQNSLDAWNSSGAIEQVAGWDNSNPASGLQSGQYPQGGMGSPQGPDDYASQNQWGSAEQPGGWNHRDPNAPYPGASYYGQNPQEGAQGNPHAGSNQVLSQAPNDSQLSQSWPNPQGAPNQFDARGQAWDGQSVLSNPAIGSSMNAAYEANDPTYNSGTGRSFGAQRPNGLAQSGTNGRGRPGAVQAGWDDGRQAAAQLGLDAGMGDMFPAGAGDPGQPDRNPMGNSSNGYWNNSAGMGQTPWQGTNAALYADPTTPRGMSPGGSGAVSPADYYSAPPGFQNNGYSQGIQPAMGENYGNAGADVSAPWNQPGMSPRNSRPAGDQQQYGYDAGQATGRFAPSRQPSSQAQNFGAPPMYYGR